MPILNYTTSIAAEKTVGEIVALLAKKGAGRITQTYRDGGIIKGVGFVFTVGETPVYFELPANEEGVEKYMLKQAGRISEAGRQKIKEQARRTAWRILKDWVAAQIALVESQQAELAQVFLPYAQHNNGRTMYELFVENNQKQLGSGE